MDSCGDNDFQVLDGNGERFPRGRLDFQVSFVEQLLGSSSLEDVWARFVSVFRLSDTPLLLLYTEKWCRNWPWAIGRLISLDGKSWPICFARAPSVDVSCLMFIRAAFTPRESLPRGIYYCKLLVCRFRDFPMFKALNVKKQPFSIREMELSIITLQFTTLIFSVKCRQTRRDVYLL